jgi:hypothetical protein
VTVLLLLVALPLIVVLGRDIVRGLIPMEAPHLEGFEERGLVRDGLRRRRRLAGQRRGRDIELLVSGGDRLQRMWFSTPFRWSLPRDGVQVEVSGLGACSVREGWIRGLGSNPLGLGEDLGVGLPALVFEGRFEAALRLDGERAVMVFAARELQAEAALEQALELVEAVEGALLGPWRRAAEQHGLQVQGPDDQGQPELRGRSAGMQLEVTVQAGRTRILATWRTALPMDLVLRAGSGGVPLGDAVLDLLLEARTSQPEQAALLLRPGMPELLLPVLHAWPESELRWDRLVLRAPRQLREELPEVLDAVVALGRALVEGPASSD